MTIHCEVESHPIPRRIWIAVIGPYEDWLAFLEALGKPITIHHLSKTAILNQAVRFFHVKERVNLMGREIAGFITVGNFAQWTDAMHDAMKYAPTRIRQ